MNQSDPSPNNWEMTLPPWRDDDFEGNHPLVDWNYLRQNDPELCRLESPLSNDSEFNDYPMQGSDLLWDFPEVQNENIGMTSASGVLTNSQTNQPQLTQAETSEAPYRTESRGRRVPLTPAQRKENRRRTDRRYREKKKMAEAELIAKNKCLEEENAKLIAENKELTGQLQTRDMQLPALIAENKRLQEENVKLIAEKKDVLGQSLTRDGQLRAEAPQRQGQDTYIAQSTSAQLDHSSVSVQVSDSEMNDSQNSHPTLPTNAVATNNDVTENQKNSRTGTCYDDTTIKLLMKEIDEDDQSNVCFSDFKGLDGECITIGKNNFPLSLRYVVERTIACFGDVSERNKMNRKVVNDTYILFCASLKEMGDIQLEEVSKDRILKWGDAIKDALRINFKVDFVMDHLKKIVHAYIGRIESQELKNMTEGISKQEAELNSRKKELAKRKELLKMYMDAAEEFNGKSLSLFT